jgi:hypothetical protein
MMANVRRRLISFVNFMSKFMVHNSWLIAVGYDYELLTMNYQPF